MKENSKSAIYNFGEYDTVYVPKGITLEEAIEWYTKEYDEIKENEINEVDYTKGFWDCNVSKEKLKEIGEDWYNGDQWNLNKNGKVQEGTIQAIQGDLYIFKTFETALKENEELKIKNNAIKRESEAYAENMTRLDNELNLEKEKSKYEWIRQNCLPQELVNKLYIPIQKIKDKIEEINKKILNAPKYDEKISVYRYQKQILQELIEESEKK